MTRISTIKRLDPRLRELIDSLIREGSCTLDDIMEHLRTMGAGDAVSRSALARYRQQAEKSMETYRLAQEMGQVWVDKLEADPKGNVGRLLVELMKTVAYRTINASLERGEETPKELELLTRSLRNVAAADHLTTDNLIKIRDTVRKEEAERMKQELEKMREGGFDGQTLDAMEERISIYLPANQR